MDGFTLPSRMDTNANKDRVAVCFEEDIQFRQKSFKSVGKDIEHSFIEVNFQKKI